MSSNGVVGPNLLSANHLVDAGPARRRGWSSESRRVMGERTRPWACRCTASV